MVEKIYQVTVISGKGGVGKSTLTSSLGAIIKNKLMVDCDVDTPNMHLVLGAEIVESHDFSGHDLAEVNPDACMGCGLCAEKCRFGAIKIENGKAVINRFLCEGCGVCEYGCPTNAITLKPRHGGNYYVAKTRHGPLIYALLEPGEENSGRLVERIRRLALEYATKRGYQFIIADGPPGTGCPVISSITGADLAVVVTEPTVSGVHDMMNALKLTSQLSVPAAVVINKWDVNREKSREIEDVCKDLDVPIIGKIRYDKKIPRLMAEGITAVEGECEAKEDILPIWTRILQLLKIKR